MDKRKLLKAIMAPAPCDDCLQREDCAAELKACRSFAQFVMLNRWARDTPRVPTQNIYARVMSNDSETKLREFLKKGSDDSI